MDDESLRKRDPFASRERRQLVRLAFVGIVVSACGAGDRRFVAETSDEYTDPLEGEVTIGEGPVVRTFRNGVEITNGESEFKAAAGAGGTGGSTGTGGTAGKGGSTTGAGGTVGTTGGSSGKGGSSTGVGGSVVIDGGTAGSFGTGGFAGGPVFDGGTGQSGPSGFWHFDDCSTTSNFLIDSSGNGANAQHALKRYCAPGISGLGVEFRDKKDIVQVPDEPQFTVGPRVAVAAWVNPTAINKDHPIVLKREGNKTAFSLGIHKDNLEMSVVLSTGKTFISRAPITANAWTHVAGMYDGRFVFLFINGEQVGQVAAAGTLRNVFAPIRIGATTDTQSFKGVIDDVWLSTNVVSKDELTGLSCISRPMTFATTPAIGNPVPFDTASHYTINVTNNDVGACRQSQINVFFNLFGLTAENARAAALADIDAGPDAPGGGTGGASIEGGSGSGGFAGAGTGGSGPVFEGGVAGSGGFAGRSGSGGSGGGFEGGVPPTPNSGIRALLNPQFLFLNPGQSDAFGVDVIASEDAEPGLHHLPFFLQRFGQNFEFQSGEVQFQLSEPTGCFIRTKRELMITDLSVIDDPLRTTMDPSVPTAHPESRGAWTFGKLMRDMAPSPEQAPAMVEQLMRTWLTNQTVNGFTVFARPSMQNLVLDQWPRTADGALDLDRSPMLLQAIVNRLDVRDLARGVAGQGRFVFNVTGPGIFNPFTFILEYSLPASTEADVLEWANLWHGLSSHPFPSEEYNAALEAVTSRFSRRGALPGAPNGSALLDLRTNDFGLVQQWELREFVLAPDSGFLIPATIKLTPDGAFNGSPLLAQFINQNEAAIVAEKHDVPDVFQGSAFLGGSVFNNIDVWSAPGVVNNEARHQFSKNTCNGCHGGETQTGFTHITPRFFRGGTPSLSGFLTGETVNDPFSGQLREMNDLGRRRADLSGLVCPPELAKTGANSARFAVPGTTIAKGISRIH